MEAKRRTKTKNHLHPSRFDFLSNCTLHLSTPDRLRNFRRIDPFTAGSFHREKSAYPHDEVLIKLGECTTSFSSFRCLLTPHRNFTRRAKEENMAFVERSHHVSRFSFTSTDISQLDIEWLLETALSSIQPPPASTVTEEEDSPPSSPLDRGFNQIPFSSPPSTLPYFNSSPIPPPTPDTPRPPRPLARTIDSISEVPLDLTSYSFPPPRPSTPPSRSSTPTPASSLRSHSISQKFPSNHSTKLSVGSGTIMVELDDFFPRKPDTTTIFPTFSTLPSSSASSTVSMRKGSEASFFSNSTGSSASSSELGRSRSTSNRSGGSGEVELKYAAYPRYVSPKPPKVEGEGGKKFKMFGISV